MVREMEVEYMCIIQKIEYQSLIEEIVQRLKLFEEIKHFE